MTRRKFNQPVIVERVKRRPMSRNLASDEQKRKVVETMQGSAPPPAPLPAPAPSVPEPQPSSVPDDFETGLEAALQQWDASRSARK